MTPLERAEWAVMQWLRNSNIYRVAIEDMKMLTDLIRQQIIEATNSEIEKRRVAEAALMNAPNIMCDQMRASIRVYNPVNKCWYETNLIACEPAP